MSVERRIVDLEQRIDGLPAVTRRTPDYSRLTGDEQDELSELWEASGGDGWDLSRLTVPQLQRLSTIVERCTANIGST